MHCFSLRCLLRSENGVLCNYKCCTVLCSYKCCAASYECCAVLCSCTWCAVLCSFKCCGAISVNHLWLGALQPMGCLHVSGLLTLSPCHIRRNYAASIFHYRISVYPCLKKLKALCQIECKCTLHRAVVNIEVSCYTFDQGIRSLQYWPWWASTGGFVT